MVAGWLAWTTRCCGPWGVTRHILHQEQCTLSFYPSAQGRGGAQKVGGTLL